MSDCCGTKCNPETAPVDPAYRRALWIALIVNAAMFGVELIGGWQAESVSLLADAVDFLGDAGNYALSLFVLGMAGVWRSRTAFAKGLTMGIYGIFVVGKAGWHAIQGVVPEPATMGIIGVLALLANAGVGVLLYAYRNGDANMRSVWLCTRNDAIGNIIVILAAIGVSSTAHGWPDIVVAAIMGTLALTASYSVIKLSWREMRSIRLAV